MATPINYPQVNGYRFSWSSIEIKLANQIFYVTGIDYDRERKRSEVRVNHPDPVGKTVGSNSYKCEVEMLLGEFNAFQQALIALASAQGNVGYGDIYFTIVVSYTEPSADTVTDTILGCTLDSTGASNKESTDPSMRKFSCSPLKILLNGVDDLGPRALQAPPGG